MSTTYYLWADVESTGINLEQDEIIEIALILTRADTLAEVGRYHSLVQPTEAGLLRLVQTPAVIRMHTKNGLLLELIEQDAAARRDIAAVDMEISDWLELNTEVNIADGDVVHLAGSGVSEFDRPLIRRLMPDLNDLLHYRSIDVGTPRRMVQAWLGRELTPDNERKPHRAALDVLGHLREGLAVRDMLMVYDGAALAAGER